MTRKWLGFREIFRDNDCHPLSITVCAIHDPTVGPCETKSSLLLLSCLLNLYAKLRRKILNSCFFFFYRNVAFMASKRLRPKGDRSPKWVIAFFSFLMRETWEVVVSFIFSDNWGWRQDNFLWNGYIWIPLNFSVILFCKFFWLDRVPRSAAFLSFSNLASICSAKLFWTKKKQKIVHVQGAPRISCFTLNLFPSLMFARFYNILAVTRS